MPDNATTAVTAHPVEEWTEDDRDEDRRPMWVFIGLMHEVTNEARRQDAAYGWESKLDLLERSSSHETIARLEDLEVYARIRQDASNHSHLDLLVEELAEVASEDDPEKMEVELVQLATLALSWAQASREKRGGV